MFHLAELTHFIDIIGEKEHEIVLFELHDALVHSLLELEVRIE